MRGMRKQREKVLGLERARRHPFDVIIAQLSVSLSLSLSPRSFSFRHVVEKLNLLNRTLYTLLFILYYNI